MREQRSCHSQESQASRIFEAAKACRSFSVVSASRTRQLTPVRGVQGACPGPQAPVRPLNAHCRCDNGNSLPAAWAGRSRPARRRCGCLRRHSAGRSRCRSWRQSPVYSPCRDRSACTADDAGGWKRSCVAYDSIRRRTQAACRRVVFSRHQPWQRARIRRSCRLTCASASDLHGASRNSTIFLPLSDPDAGKDLRCGQR